MKTNLDGFYKTDKTIESEGIWFEVADGVAFLIKRFGGFNAPKIKGSLARHYKPFARQIENGTLDASKEREIMNRVFVESCIIDWRGVEIDGVVEKFSTESCVKLLTALPDMAELLVNYASDFKSYKEDLGNF